MHRFCAFALIAATLALSNMRACAPQEWARTYGGDIAYSIHQTSDGGYIVAGSTASSADGHSDVWVAKLDVVGNVAWQHAYGQTYGPEEGNLDAYNDWASSIQQTSDGGYIVAGSTAWEEKPYFYTDSLVLKLDQRGNLLWHKVYEGRNADWARSVQETLDGGYIVAATTWAFEGNGEVAWVLKLDSNGEASWQKTFSGTECRSIVCLDQAYDIQQTSDGGYVVAGRDNEAFWVIKLDDEGNVSWQRRYGEGYGESAHSIRQTSDGGYIVAGVTDSFGAGNYDFWVLKLDGTGQVTWQRSYGGTGDDSALAIRPTSDGGYVVAGYTASFGAGGYDAWVLKLDSNGDISWEKTYGGPATDSASSIKQTLDGGYVVAGYTASFGAGGYDAWVLKLDSNGEIPDCEIVGDSAAVMQDTFAPGADADDVGLEVRGSTSEPDIESERTRAKVSVICKSFSGKPSSD
jgi:uncharacterized delta-60 repeat protein